VQSFIREQGKGAATPRPPCPSPVTIYNEQTGERLDLPCKRRMCPACGPARWRPKVMAKLHSGLGGDPDRYLALLLTAPGDVNRHYFNAHASHYWHRFWTSANRWFPGLAYWKVAELQERGHVHFHAILRGRAFVDIEQLKVLAIRSGFGEWVSIKRCSDYPATTKGAAGYFGKYLLKDYLRFYGEPNLVSMSRTWPTNWRQPVKTPSTDRWITEWQLRQLRATAIPVPKVPPQRGPLPPGDPPWRRRVRSKDRGASAPLFPE